MCNFALTRKFRAIVFPSGWDSYKFLSGIIRRSGPAVKPVAVRMVYQVANAVSLPIIGMGGIATAEDALEFIMAGATAVQVGTANFLDPKACTRITSEINQWMDAHGVKTLEEIRGCAR